MPVMIEIGSPELVPELAAAFAAGGCVVHLTGGGRCSVLHPDAIDAAEEWAEIRFFLRAWQASLGVRASLSPERPRFSIHAPVRGPAHRSAFTCARGPRRDGRRRARRGCS